MEEMMEEMMMPPLRLHQPPRTPMTPHRSPNTRCGDRFGCTTCPSSWATIENMTKSHGACVGEGCGGELREVSTPGGEYLASGDPLFLTPYCSTCWFEWMQAALVQRNEAPAAASALREVRRQRLLQPCGKGGASGSTSLAGGAAPAAAVALRVASGAFSELGSDRCGK